MDKRKHRYWLLKVEAGRLEAGEAGIPILYDVDGETRSCHVFPGDTFKHPANGTLFRYEELRQDRLTQIYGEIDRSVDDLLKTGGDAEELAQIMADYEANKAPLP